MIKLFKITAILEGISYLLLFFNMLFIKPNDIAFYKLLLYPIGMTHGILFIVYIILALLLKKSQNWDFKVLSIVLIASLLPCATFLIEKKYLKN